MAKNYLSISSVVRLMSGGSPLMVKPNKNIPDKIFTLCQ